MARPQSSSPRTPSSSSTARCRRRHTPAWVHSWNRRCAVGTLTPNDGGICRQEQPLVSTNTIAVNTARSPALRRPPPCRRTPCSGSSGAAMAHNSSGTNRRDRSSTDDHHASTTIPPIKTPSKLRIRSILVGAYSVRVMLPSVPREILGSWLASTPLFEKMCWLGGRVLERGRHGEPVLTRGAGSRDRSCQFREVVSRRRVRSASRTRGR